MRKPLLSVLLGALAVVSAACGSSGSSPGGAAATETTSPYAAPCTLLTVDEAGALRGAEVRPVEVQSRYGPDTAVAHACEYRLPQGMEEESEVSLRFYREPVAADDFDLDWRLAHTPDAVPEPHRRPVYTPDEIQRVEGLGEDALVRVAGREVSLDVRTTDGVLRITVAGVPLADARPRLEDAARRALDRLAA